MNELLKKAGDINRGKPLIKVSLAIVLGIIGLYFFWPSFHEAINQAFAILASGDRERLHKFTGQFGVWGPLVIIVAMVVQMFLIVIPSVALMTVSILAYGPFKGGVISLLAILTAYTVGYLVGHALGRTTVDKLIGQETREKVEDYVEKYGFWTVILVRLSSFPLNDAISFVAGLLRMNYWLFMGAISIGLLPLLVLIAYLGETNERLQAGLLWVSGIGLIVFIVYKIYNHRKNKQLT
jgi:uncharacterized membrane protein YdjX (TVP38/TMEM64 family)